MIIDFHTHMYPDNVAKIIMSRLPRPSGIVPSTDATYAGTKAKLLEWGVDKHVMLPVGTHPDCSAPNAFAASIADDYTLCFGTVHPRAKDVEAEVEKVAEMGLRGVKLHPQYQGVIINDAAYVRIVKRCAKLKLPVLFHTGADPGRPYALLAEPEDIVKLLNIVEDLDGLTMILPHMGALMQYDEVERLLVGRNVYFDTSFSCEHIDPVQFGRMIDNHGYQRILYGSDCPWINGKLCIEAVRALHLPAEQEEAIFWRNAARLLKLDITSPD